MPRLVTFGCSFAYGHGLPDCFIPPDNHGPLPSKGAWPKLVANKLNYECVNLAVPGAGNFQILIDVLKTNYYPDDLVLIAFSYFERYNHYKLTDNLGNYIRIGINDTTNHKNLILAELVPYHENKLYWDNWLAIHHCEQFLSNKKIKNFLFFGMPVGARHPKPDMLNLENFIDIPFIKKDSALDGAHSGVKSHELLATLIYDKIKEHELY